MAIKGDLKLEIDEQGIEVRITITPDEGGGDITPESIAAVLNEKKVRSGIDSEAVDKAFRAIARKKTEPLTFVAAAGAAPQPGTPESVTFEECRIPERLAAIAQRVLAAGVQAARRARQGRKEDTKEACASIPPREDAGRGGD